MTRSTSNVAVCCSRASESSRSAWRESAFEIGISFSCHSLPPSPLRPIAKG